MTEASMTDPYQLQRKRLIFRANHRGTKEADLLLGRFAERYVPEFTSEQLQQFDHLLTLSDPDIYDWVTGKNPIPSTHNTSVMALLASFRLINL
ncbi:MAG: succinate dehydrogenase assembly factor 2 [Alphaproteobacteria bacterium]